MYCYLFYCPSTRLIKIGRSSNVKKRELALNVANPFGYMLFFSSQIKEKELHKKYEKSHIVGEWYRLKPKDIKYITGSQKYVPKALWYRNTKKDRSIDKLIEAQNKNSNEGELEFSIKNFPNYVSVSDKIFNQKTGRELKPKLKNGIIGYNLKGKFTPYKKIEFERPKTFDCPF